MKGTFIHHCKGSDLTPDRVAHPSACAMNGAFVDLKCTNAPFMVDGRATPEPSRDGLLDQASRQKFAEHGWTTSLHSVPGSFTLGALMKRFLPVLGALVLVAAVVAVVVWQRADSKAALPPSGDVVLQYADGSQLWHWGEPETPLVKEV